MMKHQLFIFLILVFLLTACNTPVSPAQPASGGTCGDGTCSGPENASNCPADCTVPGIDPNPGSEVPTVRTQAPVSIHQADAPLYFTTMTHMESNWNDDKNENLFLQHVTQLRYGMDLAEEYDALITIESEKPFARANVIWDLNIMEEVRERGFGVGTHCDIGFNEAPMSVEDFSRLFVENKTLVDALIGAENNLGCSGGGSVNDWAQAASLAGFKYLDGIVAMHYLSMPMASRPGSEWTDEYIRNGHFHLNAPTELYQRIYPIGVANALDFLADPDPVIVVSSGELGLFSALAEQGREPGGGPILHDDEYALDNLDVDTLVATIQAVAGSRDRTKIAKLTVYLPSNAYAAENEAVLRYFFEQLQTLQQQGILTWATQRQVYEAYIDWNY